jgi:hypothetical protein
MRTTFTPLDSDHWNKFALRLVNPVTASQVTPPLLNEGRQDGRESQFFGSEPSRVESMVTPEDNSQLEIIYWCAVPH